MAKQQCMLYALQLVGFMYVMLLLSETYYGARSGIYYCSGLQPLLLHVSQTVLRQHHHAPFMLTRCCLAYRLSEQLNALGEEAARMPGGQEGPSDDMSGLVDGIMHQLLAKDVLYQPIQEIGARYPQWLADHRYPTHTPPPPNLICQLPLP